MLVLILMLLGAAQRPAWCRCMFGLPLAHPAVPATFRFDERRHDQGPIYGFIRVVFDLLGNRPGGPSVIVLFFGGIPA